MSDRATTSAWRGDRCRSCSAPIVWAKTPRGKSMPVDAVPSEDGTLALYKSPGLAAPLACAPSVYDAHAGLPILDGEARFKSHFASCPNADQHRRGRKE